LIRIGRRLGWVLLCCLACGAGRAAAQQGPGFDVRFAGLEEGWRPVVRTEGVLRDGALREALTSGLPLRLSLRVELWQKRLFDRLIADQEVHVALVQDPLSRDFVLDVGLVERRFASLAEVQEALGTALRVSLRPTGSGRFYYLASLEVETLSLSDLEELRRWLRGEVQPAVAGERSAGRAIEQGLRRVFVRVIGLPTRRYEARSGTFLLR